MGQIKRERKLHQAPYQRIPELLLWIVLLDNLQKVGEVLPMHVLQIGLREVSTVFT